MFVVANILQPLIDIAEDVLVFFHNEVGFGWGMSIVMLTVVVRVVLLPLAVKQYKSMRALQKLQPQIKEIQAKYKDDRQRQQQEMMKFYQQNKVNPLSSCLPMLLQFPVMFALFFLLKNDLSRHVIVTKGWLFIPNLLQPAKGGVLITLIVIYVVSQIGSSLLMTTTMDRNQKIMMLLLPLVFVVIIVQFPTGLIVYWITTNIWTVFQQLFIKWLMRHEEPAVAVAGAAVSGGTKGKASKPPPPPPRKKRRRR